MSELVVPVPLPWSTTDDGSLDVALEEALSVGSVVAEPLSVAVEVDDVGLSVAVPVSVLDDVGLSVAVPVSVLDDVGLSVAVPVSVLDDVGLSVAVPVSVDDEVGLSVAVPVSVDELVGLSVAVPVSVDEDVGLSVDDEVGLSVLEDVGLSVDELVGLSVLEDVGLSVDELVGLSVLEDVVGSVVTGAADVVVAFCAFGLTKLTSEFVASYELEPTEPGVFLLSIQPFFVRQIDVMESLAWYGEGTDASLNDRKSFEVEQSSAVDVAEATFEV